MASSPVHILSAVGAGRLSKTTYDLDGQRCAGRFAVVAIAQILNLRGARASLLVTDLAERENLPGLAIELQAFVITPAAVRVPDGRTVAELEQIFLHIVETVQSDERVILDLTAGLRHLPFAYFAALTYLTAYKNVTIDAIYYGAYELRDQESNVTPLLNVTSLFELTQWYHALQSAQETGSLGALQGLLHRQARRLGEERRQDARLNSLRKHVGVLASALMAGLPLEVGAHSRSLVTSLDAEGASHSPALALSLTRLATWANDWALPDPAPKPASRLTEEELERQLRLAEWYVGHDSLPAALLVLREWLISLLMLRSNHAETWLGHGVRQPFETRLNALQLRTTAGIATPAEKTLDSLWQTITNARNNFAHAGMTPSPVATNKDNLRNVLQRCRALLNSDTVQQLPIPDQGHLLITPLGRSSGVLYTGLRLLQPNYLVVVTSADVRSSVPDALDQAGYIGPHHVLVVDNPFTDFGAAKQFMTKEFQRRVVRFQNVIVNLTGGTTVLQYVADQLGQGAGELGVRVRRVALVDRRSPEEQRDSPYQLGELVTLGPLEEAIDAE